MPESPWERRLYVAFCLVMSGAVLWALTRHVFVPLAAWLEQTTGGWDLLVWALLAVAIYPFVMRRERRACIEHGLQPPKHLWSRRRPLIATGAAKSVPEHARGSRRPPSPRR